MKSICKVMLVALSLGAISPVQAKPNAPKAKPPVQKPDKVEAYLKEHDRNKDGVIDRSEYTGGEFDKWDKNKDGKLDKGELSAMLNPSKKGK